MRAFATLLLLFLAAPWAAAQSTVYSSDFEVNDGGWVGTGDWQWGAPSAAPDPAGCSTTTTVFPTGAASGTNVWGTNLNGCHAASQDAQLTQTFDFTSVTGTIEMCWNQFVNSGGNTFDMASVEVNGVRQYLSSGSSGTPPVYQNECIPMSAYAGQNAVMVTYRFVTTAVVNRSGWYVDDVTITTTGVASTPTPQVGVALSPVWPNPLSERGQMTLAVDQTQTVTVELVNVLGQRVASVFDGTVTAGQTATLDLDVRGLASGVYVVRATGETVRAAVRVTVQ